MEFLPKGSLGPTGEVSRRAHGVRAARADDAEPASRVMRRSIRDLYNADYGGDVAHLAGWLSNKTPENVATWISDPRSHVLVATEDEANLGIAAITATGEVTLNYVSRDARFRGVSRALINRLEARARGQRLSYCTLNSTNTACWFYLSLGYQEQTAYANGSSHSMAKSLI